MTLEPTTLQLKKLVLDKGLCTQCGACHNLCPHYLGHGDRTVVFHDCDKTSGACYEVCPRTPTNLEALRQVMFDPADITAELGALKGLYITRASDPSIRGKAQHGGTVSALIQFALKEGIIEKAVLAGEEEILLPAGRGFSDPERVVDAAGSRFVVSPTVAAFNELAREDIETLGVVATPCQAMALAKMWISEVSRIHEASKKIGLVLGLFCGWAFNWKKLKNLLAEKLELETITRMDIPPSRFHSMIVETRDGRVEISIDELRDCVRPSCNYCFDMTAEFSDISVGSARLPSGWDESRGWNHLIVRTEKGQKLLEMARDAGCIEFHDVPEENLDRLKTAAAGKKREAAARLAQKSGTPGDLLYVPADDPLLRDCLTIP